MKNKSNFFYFLLLLLSFLAFPKLSIAGIVPCGETEPCTLCHLIIGIHNLVEFGKDILVTITLVAIFISGIIYVVSSGNEKMITQAKSFFTASLVGFTVTVGAWLIVNITIFWIANARSDLGIGITNWNEFTCDTSSSTLKGTVPAEEEPDSPASTPTGYTYDPGIESQMNDASGELKNLLSCMQPKLPDGAKRITSISDSAGITKCRNSWRPPCAHSQNSCHYGGKSCPVKSYAVDIAGTTYFNQITKAAKECASGARTLNESNHTHVSIGKASKCGCDNF